MAQVNQIELLPAHEFPLDKTAIERFRSRYRERFQQRNEKESLYQQVSSGALPAGIEYYLPLFAESTGSLFSYLPAATRLLALGELEASAQRFWQDVQNRYQDRAIDLLRPILPPQELYFTVDELFGLQKKYSRIRLSRAELPAKAGVQNAPALPLPDLTVNHQLAEPLTALRQYLTVIKQQQGRVIFLVESEGRRESLLQLLHKSGIRLNQYSDVDSVLNADVDVAIAVGALEQGVQLNLPSPLALISENELFGQKVSQRRRRKHSQQISSETIIRSLAELSIGQPIV
ncbi:MAG: transcription-repair coupling factor, partial [Chromatiaceae bacterium]